MSNFLWKEKEENKKEIFRQGRRRRTMNIGNKCGMLVSSTGIYCISQKFLPSLGKQRLN
jgi:hypothetical protein